MIVPPVPIAIRGRVANGLFYIATTIMHLAYWICPEKTGDIF